MNRININDTHLYPGCTAILFFKIAPKDTTLVASATFSDGVVVDAEVEQIDPNELIIRIEPYTTAKGTGIPKKSWRLRYDKTQELWKVVARM